MLLRNDGVRTRRIFIELFLSELFEIYLPEIII